MHKKSLLLATGIACALLLAERERGEPARRLSDAVKSDPVIREADARRLAALEAKPQARGLLFPQANVDGQYTKSDSDGSVTFVQDVLDTTTPDPTDTDHRRPQQRAGRGGGRLAVPRAGHADVVPLGPVAAAQARRRAGRARGGQLPCVGTGPGGAGLAGLFRCARGRGHADAPPTPRCRRSTASSSRRRSASRSG